MIQYLRFLQVVENIEEDSLLKVRWKRGGQLVKRAHIFYRYMHIKYYWN